MKYSINKNTALLSLPTRIAAIHHHLQQVIELAPQMDKHLCASSPVCAGELAVIEKTQFARIGATR